MPSFKILVALDGSTGGRKALRFAVRLAASPHRRGHSHAHSPAPPTPLSLAHPRPDVYGAGGSGGGGENVAHAATLGSASGGVELHSISIVEIGRHSGALLPMSDEREWADSPFAEVIRQAQAEARQSGVELIPHVAVGHEVKWISEFAGERGFDLLVVGFAGHSELDGAMGGTCYGLVQHAPCAVLVVKT